MHIRFSFLIFFSFFQVMLFSQEVQWKLNLNYFFDNAEFSKSTLINDQTMTGVHFSPQLGLKWDAVHTFFVGSDLLKISGSQHTTDSVNLIACYRYQTAQNLLVAGAFPRQELLSNYSDLFFQDSINYFKPIMQGLFLEYRNASSFCNVWLDWNGHQTATKRETFYIGASAHKQIGWVFADFQSYMYHFANTRPTNPAYNLYDNALAHLSMGVSYANKKGLDTLFFAVGILAGYERRRGPDLVSTPLGAVFRLNAQYLRLGIRNTLYLGNPRMTHSEMYSKNLYWSNPFLRSGSYLQSKVFLNVIRNKFIQANLASIFHFSQAKLMFQQTFTVQVSIDNLKINKHKLL